MHIYMASKTTEYIDLDETALASMTRQQKKELLNASTLEDINLSVKAPGYNAQFFAISDKLPFKILDSARETVAATLESAVEKQEARGKKRADKLAEEFLKANKKEKDAQIDELELKPFNPMNRDEKVNTPYYISPTNDVYRRNRDDTVGPIVGTYNSFNEEIDFIAPPLLIDKDKKAAVIVEEDDGVETLTNFRLRGKDYLRSNQNELWLLGPGGTMGDFQGIYNPVSNIIRPAPAPEFVDETRRSPRLAAKAAKAAGAEYDDAETLTIFKLNGKSYLRSTINEIWLLAPGNNIGEWQGIYNPLTKKIMPAPEPEFVDE